MNYWDIYIFSLLAVIITIYYLKKYKYKDNKKLKICGNLLWLLAFCSLPGYYMFTSLSNLDHYKNEFLIPLKEGCYYGEGVNAPKINLSAPLEHQGDYNMGYEKITRCWTMNDYNLNETAIDSKIEEIGKDKNQLLYFWIGFPFLNAIAVSIWNKIEKYKKSKHLNISQTSLSNGGEIKESQEEI